MKESNVASMQTLWNVCYLDSYASWHFTNNKNLFVKELYSKCLNFTTAESQILWTKKIRMIAILLSDKSSLKFQDVAYIPNCNLNLIFFSQLRNNNITYIDNLKTMTLIQVKHLIAYAKCNQNLFVLELVTSNKAMQITRYN